MEYNEDKMMRQAPAPARGLGASDHLAAWLARNPLEEPGMSGTLLR